MIDRPIKSAERTLAIFELFSAAARPLSVSEIVTSLDIPQSSATMLLRHLSGMGYLDFDRRSRKYKPTIRILLLSSWVARRFSETGKIAEGLEGLHQATGELVILALQHNAQMQSILTRGPDRAGAQFVVSGGEPHASAMMIRSGVFASLTCSAMGRAILSLKPDAEIRSWVRRANAEAEDSRLRVGESEFMEIIEQVRRDGYAETDGVWYPGLGALALAMPSPMDSMPMAVSVSMPLERIPEKKMAVLAELSRFREQFSRDHAPDEGMRAEPSRA